MTAPRPTPEPAPPEGPEAERRDTRRLKAVLVAAATLGFVTSPLWTSGFGGFDPEAYPIPQREPPVQPAGYAFSIWGPIYLWLTASAAFGLFARAEDPGWDRVRWPLIASLAIGAPWISVAQLNPPLATLMIWLMLAGALAALLRAPAADRWWLAAPLALYAGWLSAASFVALALLGAGYGWVFGAVGWAWAALLAALALGIAVQKVLPAGLPFYGAAIAWALIAVAVRNGTAEPGVTGLALIGALAVGWEAVKKAR